MKNYLVSLLAILLTASASILYGADGPLQNLTLPALGDDKEMLVLEVEYAPGQQSQPHRHNAHVFVYVLEGTVRMGVAGGETKILKPGDVFYENPDDVHAVSGNASDTEPAKILVHMLKTVGMPVSTPISQ